MARRRAKSFKKYKKKNQLGATAGGVAEFDSNRGMIPNGLTKGDWAKVISEELEELAKKIPQCAGLKKAPTYEAADGNTVMNEGLSTFVFNGWPRDQQSIFEEQDRTLMSYPGSKQKIKKQVIPPIAKLFREVGAKRHIEGFLGGGGAFVAFPEDITKNSVAIEFKEDVALAHQALVRPDKDTPSPFEQCVDKGFSSLTPVGDMSSNDEDVAEKQIISTKDKCLALIFTQSKQINSYSSKEEEAFIKSLATKEVKNRIKNQSELYSRPGVKIVQGNFFNFLNGKLQGNNGEKLTPEAGDFIYMDPPYLGTEYAYFKNFEKSVDPESRGLVKKFMVVDSYRGPGDQMSGLYDDIITGKEGTIVGDDTFPLTEEAKKDGMQLFNHRKLWKETAGLYEKMKKKNTPIHLAISHSAEGRFHWLIKNYFKDAIDRGEVKACRIAVKRLAGQTRGYYQLASDDLPREQEWVILVSPNARTITCDEVPIENINSQSDRRILKEMKNFLKNRDVCRTELGKKYIKEKIEKEKLSPSEAYNLIETSNNGKRPPAEIPAFVEEEWGKPVYDLIERNKKIPAPKTRKSKKGTP